MDWQKIGTLLKLSEAVRLGMNRVIAFRLKEIQAGRLDESVTVSEVAHNRIIIDASNTSALFAFSDTSMDEDLFDLEQALVALGFEDLRSAFVNDKDKHSCVMLFIPRH